MRERFDPSPIVNDRLLSLILILCCFAAFAACRTEPEREAPSAPTSVASVETFLPESMRTIFKRSCESCHGYDGRGITGVAPDMLHSFGRKPEEWENYFVNPQSLHPGAQMPSTVWMSQDEIKSVSAFLAKLPDPNNRDSTPEPR
ncbi:MAG: cytochrome c [Acidobacteriota bacterium]